MKKAFRAVLNPIAEAPVDPPAEQPADEDLRARVMEGIAADGRLADENVDIEVTEGCAVLTGSVSREYLRQLVDAHVSAVPGILVVKDQLIVEEAEE